MTGRYEPPTGHDETSVTAHGQPGGPPGIRIFRAGLVLALMIVIGIILLPSATRGPRLPSPSAAAAHHSVSVPTTSTTRPPTTTTTLPAVAYSSIKVLVANGTTTSHGASEVRTWLKDHGFDTSPFPAYDTTVPQTDDSIFIVGSGTRTMALEVARALTLGASVIAAGGATPPVSTSAGADVVVVLGNDLASRADAGTLGRPPTPSSNASP